MSFTMNSSNISSNYAGKNGGGLYVLSDGGASVSVSIVGQQPTFKGNQAKFWGGAIFTRVNACTASLIFHPQLTPCDPILER